MNVLDLEGAACVDRWEVFDRTDSRSHEVARQICRTCPVVLACQVYALDVLHNTATSAAYGIQGTWGGRLFGRPGLRRPVREVKAS